MANMLQTHGELVVVKLCRAEACQPSRGRYSAEPSRAEPSNHRGVTTSGLEARSDPPGWDFPCVGASLASWEDSLFRECCVADEGRLCAFPAVKLPFG